MNLTSSAANPRKEAELIPLINVVFLLLIFFMLAGQLRDPQPVQVQAPEATQTEKLSPEPFKLWLTQNGQLHTEQPQSPLTAEDLPALFAAMPAPLPTLQLHADARVPMRYLKPITTALAKIGFTQVQLVTQGAP